MIGSMYEYIEEHSYDEMVRKCINEYGKYGRHRVLKEICRKLNVDMRPGAYIKILESLMTNGKENLAIKLI